MAEATFDQFWFAYPRKEAKQAARRAWDKRIRDMDPNAIMLALARYQFNPDVTRRPHPASWLNGERWTDEQPPGMYAQPPTRPSRPSQQELANASIQAAIARNYPTSPGEADTERPRLFGGHA